MIKITTEDLQAVWTRAESITALVMPSPLHPSAKNIVFLGAVGFQLTASEAQRLLKVLNGEPAEASSYAIPSLS